MVLAAIIGGLAIVGIGIFALMVIPGKTEEVRRLTPEEEHSYELD